MAHRADDLPREVLPIPDRESVGTPEVPVIPLDDIGLGACSEVGEPCQAPTSERLQTDIIIAHTQGNEFTGRINWVQIDVGAEDFDHLISPEKRFHLAMAKQ